MPTEAVILGGELFATYLPLQQVEKLMALQQSDSAEAEDQNAPTIPHKEPAGGTGTLEAAIENEPNKLKQALKVLGPGLITGASDDDPSGIGTYSTAGASLGSPPSGSRW
jgi:hypothetical protein